MEDEEFQLIKGQLGKEKLLMQVKEKPYYLTWWLMADISRTCIEQYETMAQLICDTSLLKACNLRYKKLTVASKFCDKCDKRLLSLSHTEAEVRQKNGVFEGNQPYLTNPTGTQHKLNTQIYEQTR